MGGASRRGSERVLGSGHLIGIFLGVVVLCCVFFTLGYVMGHSQDAAGRLALMADTDTGTAGSDAAPAAPASATRTAPAGSEASQPAAGTGEWNFSGAGSVSAPGGAGNGAGNAGPGAAEAGGANPAPAAVAAASEPGATKAVSSGVPVAAASGRNGEAAPAAVLPARMAPGPSNAAAKPAGKFAAPAIPKGALVLQVAALESENDALAMTGVLQGKHFPAFVVRPGGDNLFRVQVGPYKTKAEAILARKWLEQEGFQPIFKH